VSNGVTEEFPGDPSPRIRLCEKKKRRRTAQKRQKKGTSRTGGRLVIREGNICRLRVSTPGEEQTKGKKVGYRPPRGLPLTGRVRERHQRERR